MIATEKYLQMNYCLIELRNGIIESDVDEAEEAPNTEKNQLCMNR